MTEEIFRSNNPTTNQVHEAIKKMDWDEPQKYRVEWASSEKWDFDASYAVKEFRFGGGASSMMLLLGPKGGEWLIDANPAGQPKVRHQRSDGYESQDRLAEIRIFGEQFNWRNRVLRMMEGAADTVKEETL